MVVCWDCRMELKSRENDGEIEVYDADNRCWVTECPNCGSYDFVESEELDYDDAYYDDDY